MRLFRTTLLLLLIGLPPVVAHGMFTSPAAVSDDTPGDLAQSFSVSAETQVPGKVLKPGRYTLRVVDHLRDRVVLRIEDEKGRTESLFLALPNNSIGQSAGPVNWAKAGKKEALRGFVFPGGNAVEFVYGKEQAVEIAKATSQKVPAIDPASEGMPASGNLSHDDMTMITLWRLSPTTVGPADHPEVGIQAEKVTPPRPAPAPTAPAPVQTASARSAGTAAAPVTSTPTPVRHRVAPKPAAADPVQVATVHRPAVRASELPQTGSDLPSIGLAGVLLLGLAGGLRVLRLRSA